MTRLAIKGLIILIFCVVAGLIIAAWVTHSKWEKLREAEDKLQNGDIIFITSQSSQNKAIQLATHSKYSHCGLIIWEAGDCYVWEAAAGVSMTNFYRFIQKAEGGHFTVRRLKDYQITFSSPNVMDTMSSLYYRKYRGKPYDPYFEWSDDKIYCSELVWKLYNETTGLKIGTLQKLRDFDLTNREVRQKLKERYGDKIPLNETVISPESIYGSKLLETVYSE